MGPRGLWGSQGNVEHSWAGQGRAAPSAWGCAHLPRLRAVWAPDVPAGREVWGGGGGESCQHAPAATSGASPGAEPLPGPWPPLGMRPCARRPCGRPAGQPRGPLGDSGAPLRFPNRLLSVQPLALGRVRQPGPVAAGIRAAREGLSPAAVAGTRRGNCSWQRAQRALRSWHRRRRNSVTAERQALRLQSADPHAAPAVRVPGREISARRCWRARETSLCNKKGAVFQTGQVTSEGQLLK